MAMSIDIQNRLKGVMFGQAIGDALGLGTESMTKEKVAQNYPNKLTRYDQIIQTAHTSRWHKGDWTDDTEMWLCIARGIIKENGKVNIHTIAQEFKNWHNGTPLGCGGHTNKVLIMGDYVERPYDCAKLWWELSRKNAAANGALMRASIIGLLPHYCTAFAEDVCRLTHFDPRCIGSCVVYCQLINSLVYGRDAPDVNGLCKIADCYDERISKYIIMAYEGTLDSITLDDHTMGYTLNTLFVGLWAYFHSSSFEDGLIEVVNAGGDTDTNAAVACSLLGAKYGFDAIPDYYVENLYRENEMSEISEKLIKLVTKQLSVESL